MALTELSHTIYILISIATTIWVARTLSRGGRAFLIEAFAGNEGMADSVNRLLVVGFYLINIGFIGVWLRYGSDPRSFAEMFETLGTRIGVVLLVLGAMHFLNVVTFNAMRNHAKDREARSATAPPTAAC